MADPRDQPMGERREVARVPVAEERASISTVTEERVAARVTVRTEAQEVPLEETLRRESAGIERVPVDRIVEEAPAIREEDGVTVIPVVEEVLVRRFRVIEELHVSVDAEEVVHRETVTLRRQEAVVEEPGAPVPAEPPADP